MELSFVASTVSVILLVYLFYKYFIEINNYWEKKGVPTVPGALPLIGHLSMIFRTHKSLPCFCAEIYKANTGRSMVGFYQARNPTLMLMDPELIKTVLIKDFPKFHENVFNVNEKIDPLVSKNPFFTSGDKWKLQRNRLSYALMSSKKLRILCLAIARVCEKFTKYLADQVERSKDGICEIDTKIFSNCFTGEVVASAGFGVEGDFFVNGSGPNSFREAVEGFMEPSFLNSFMQTMLFLCPRLNTVLQLPFLPKKMDSFFRRIIREMISLREKDGIPRNDFLQLMLENSKSKSEEIDEESIAASATSFFLDGYETSAITLGFFAYQLAENPDVQTKLRDEVNTILEKHEGQMSYECLGEMTYMDQALNESMRLYPALGVLQKKSSEPLKIVGEDGIECTLEPNTDLVISVQGIHRDPKYWPNPNIFDPERFNDERKHERPKMAFLPFGEGPRICVGMRFALLQIKAAASMILKEFSIEKSSKNNRPLVYGPGAILTSIEGGVWVKLRSLKRP
ncbi:cytochrome P450 6a2-like [Venturia canescens]|uniref:cytochrome P450 6a2-like n=1 Tax=Venturia canescens TaxID=32260 RepID=UPI001C9C149B|nr:cytochrome P450 6a2-like [Venturia canescens]